MLPKSSLQLGGRAIVGTCDHCDSEEISKISLKLLNCLAEASVKQGTKINEPKVNQLKTKLLETVCLPVNSERLIMPVLHGRLDSFNNASSAQSGFLSRSMSSMSAAFNSSTSSSTASTSAANDPAAILAQQTAELAGGLFQSDERTEIAIALIRKHDRDHEHHCDKEKCGDSCVFAPTRCANEGCPGNSPCLHSLAITE